MLKFLQSAVFDRIFNKYTTKGIENLLVALVLGSTGVFSEEFIETMANQKWTFIRDFVTQFKPYIIAVAIFFGLLAGYNLFRREFGKLNIKALEDILRKKQIDLEIKEIDLKIKKIDLELGGINEKHNN